MKNFNWETFTKKIAIKSDVKTMYDAWAKSGEIEKWFLSKCDYLSSNGDIIPKTQNCAKGDTYQWSWFLYDIVEGGKIVSANGLDNFQFTFAGDCLVEVSLEQMEDHVFVTLTQSNIPPDDKSKRDIRIGCSDGWAFYLVNLKSVYEGGIDLRNKDPRFKSQLNN